MKKFQLLNWILFAFIALQFSACDNEPLEGEFPQDDDLVGVEEGGFVANIGGLDFIAETASGILTSENKLTITGIKTESGESIVLTVEEAGVGSFNITAGLGNENSGVYIETDNPLNPYISAGSLEGSGEMNITEFDTETLTVSGTFSFTGARITLDEEGNPILDGEGNPVIEFVEITSGAFNKIVYILDDDGGGTPVEDEFFAKVDGVNFVPVGVTTTLNTIGGIPVVKIVAVNEEGAIIRIDIPEEIGVGTFEMEEISDGTKLISLYNPNTGGENLTSNPGTITITKFNTFTGIIEATFSFTATDPLGLDPTVAEITQGSFAVDYVVTPGEIVTSFTAEIDGTFFNPDSIIVGETFFNGISRFTIIAISTETNQKMGLFFPTDIEVGSYDMSTALIVGDEKFGQYTPDFGNSMTFISNPGILTIIDYDVEAGIIEGTFSFSATDILGQDPAIFEITTGEFTLEL